MKNMSSKAQLIALGAVAMLAVISTSGAAQSKPTATDTSSIRIKLSKGVADPGSRVDTVFVNHTDTVTVRQTQYRVDTVTKVVTNTVTVARVDTMTIQVPPPMSHPRLPTGFYLGVAGGGAFPAGSLYNPNNTGPSGQFQAGWQSLDTPLGLRIDGNYSRPAQDAGYASVGNGVQSSFDNVNFDVKYRLPFLTRTLGISPQFSVYAIGGGTWAAYQNARIEMNSDVAGFGPANAALASGWQHAWGWNAGGGASLLVRSVEIFAESRAIMFTPGDARQARLVPVVLGINWYGDTVLR
jgi:hypothetical protein